jgi:prepilin-type N-terminal cleavage/methylation domain-containing protein
MNFHRKKKNNKSKPNQGFSLIELLVSMFIFALVMGAMVAVSVAGFQSYQKSKAIKRVTEDIGYAINLFTKDVRMGKIKSDATSDCVSLNLTDPPKSCLVVTRNSGGKTVCYKIDPGAPEKLTLYENGVSGNWCSGGSAKILVDLTGTGMNFDTTKSGFYNMITSPGAVLPPNKIRGWSELNLDIENPSMATDSIGAQTTVSSRDYGWENVP